MKPSNLLKKNSFIYSMSFFIPAFIMFIVYVMTRVYPFGDNTILISDCNAQYIDYFAYLKTIITTNNDFLYTFSKNLGGDMIGLTAYYLISPLNIIPLFFSNAMLPVGLSLLVLVKIGLCGLTLNYFLTHSFDKTTWHSLIFSTTYALCGYTMAYYWDVMWIDGVIILPLVILGIEKIIFYKKPTMYILALSYAIITNYYIGFMICIFSLIYFLYKFLTFIDTIIDLKQTLHKAYCYIFSSLFAVGISCFTLLPTLYALNGGKAKFALSNLVFKENFQFIDLFSKFFTNALDSGQLIDGLPFIFCGTLIVVLVILYFLNSKILLKEKLLSAGVIGVLFISFHINTFNLIWHGFNSPVWFPYRYSFVFCFFLIYLSYTSLINIKSGITPKNITICFAIILVTTILVLSKPFENISILCVYFDLFLILVSCISIYLMIKSKINNNSLMLILSLLQVANLGLNSLCYVFKEQNWIPSKMSSYTHFIKSNKSIIDKIKHSDASLYRIEKSYKRSLNDAMQLNYNGLSHFSSCEKLYIRQFMRKMGCVNNSSNAYYKPAVPVSTDSLLGVKYYLSKKDISKPYNFLFSEDNIKVYQNPYALPFGFAVDKNIKDLSITNTIDLFDIQNSMFKSMVSTKNFGDVFTPADIYDVEFVNLELAPDDKKLPADNFDDDDDDLLNKLNNEELDDNDEPYITYKKSCTASDAYINYTISVTSPNYLYMYASAPTTQSTEIFVNDIPLGKYFNYDQWNINQLGAFNVGDTITFKIKVLNSSIKLGNIYFYYEDIDTLDNYCSELQKQPCNLEKISSSHLKGTINIEDGNKYLLLTIPYEKPWKVTVDGQKVTPIMVCDALMCIPTEKGMHNIDLKYRPNIIYIGCIVTLLSVVSTSIYVVSLKRKK